MSKASQILKKLKELESKRRDLVDLLLKTDKLAVGTLRRAKRPCGNPRCRQCAEGPSHEQVVFYYKTTKGRQTSRFVRKDEEDRFEKASGHYKEFRAALRKLKHLNSEEFQLLGALQAARALDPVNRNS